MGPTIIFFRAQLPNGQTEAPMVPQERGNNYYSVATKNIHMSMRGQGYPISHVYDLLFLSYTPWNNVSSTYIGIDEGTTPTI